MLPPTPPFIILSLPRSRSAWLAHFLRYSGRAVHHDLATECSSVGDFKAKLRLLDGTVETGAVLGWRLIREELPEAKLVVVRRDFREVGLSLAKFGLQPPWHELIQRAMMLDAVSEVPGVLTIEYSALDDPLVCKALFEFCLDLPFDWAWWQQFHTTNIQVNMPRRLAHLAANYANLEAFKLEVSTKSQLLPGGPLCLN